tara:strand:- start:1127 stop:1774 length:648 start_codon:yes stop_codon:yes gene_type:complete
MISKTLLAIETSSEICGTAIIKENKILSLNDEHAPRKHSEILPELTKKVLDNTGLNFNDLDGIALSIGPGSFTGLRIGLGFSKGIAYAKSLPIIPVPSLLGLAFLLKKNKPKSGILLSHARKVFFQEFLWSHGVPHIKTRPCVGDIKEYISKLDRGFHFNCSSIIPRDTNMYEVTPSAGSIGLLGSRYFKEWVKKDTYEIVPDYIAPFEVKSNAK